MAIEIFCTYPYLTPEEKKCPCRVVAEDFRCRSYASLLSSGGCSEGFPIFSVTVDKGNRRAVTFLMLNKKRKKNKYRFNFMNYSLNTIFYSNGIQTKIIYMYISMENLYKIKS